LILLDAEDIFVCAQGTLRIVEVNRRRGGGKAKLVRLSAFFYLCLESINVVSTNEKKLKFILNKLIKWKYMKLLPFQSALRVFSNFLEVLDDFLNVFPLASMRSLQFVSWFSMVIAVVDVAAYFLKVLRRHYF